MNKCLVCGWKLEGKKLPRSSHAGRDYRFCSPGCKEKFDKSPAGFAKAAA